MNLARVLKYLAPLSEFVLRGETLDGLEWAGPGIAPTQAECDAAWVTIQAQDLADAQAATVAATNGRTLEDQAIAALAANKVFYQRTSSTTAQVLAQVKALSRQNNALIRLLLKRLDGVD